ncbi:hypothetical protein OAM67_00215 [bacterium]|nr:hypothetical protein [bacterium]
MSDFRHVQHASITFAPSVAAVKLTAKPKTSDDVNSSNSSNSPDFLGPHDAAHLLTTPQAPHTPPAAVETLNHGNHNATYHAFLQKSPTYNVRLLWDLTLGSPKVEKVVAPEAESLNTNKAAVHTSNNSNTPNTPNTPNTSDHQTCQPSNQISVPTNAFTVHTNSSN